MDDLEKAIHNIEARIGVRPGFFEDLAKEDDWSFVIKSHALLESACAVKAFGLLIDRERRFILALSELRNQLVHNAKNTTFKLADYVSSLDKNQKATFVESFGYAYLYEGEEGKELIEYPDKVLTEPKRTMWLGLKSLALLAFKWRPFD